VDPILYPPSVKNIRNPAERELATLIFILTATLGGFRKMTKTDADVATVSVTEAIRQMN
jgi:hypothetical protein